MEVLHKINDYIVQINKFVHIVKLIGCKYLPTDQTRELTDIFMWFDFYKKWIKT